MTDFLIATAFLTRVPVRLVPGAGDVGRAARWFPLVGGAIGGAAALAAWVLRDVIGMPPALSAAVLVSLGAWLTGAIHLDGLADLADGFGGGRSRDEVLRIMRDPTVGAYGVIALVAVITMKVAALTTLLERRTATSVLVAAPAISRWTIVVLGAWLRYARAEGGLGQAVTRATGMTGLLVATAVTAVVAFAALGTAAIPSWILATAVTLLLGRASRRRIGGVTGDVFGAAVELTETTVLIGGVLVAGRA